MTNQSTPIINHFVAVIKSEQFENSIERIEDAAQSIASDMNLNVVKKLSHMFSPQGITLVYILSESHLIIHTWPESGVVHVDLVTCSPRLEKEFGSTLKYAFADYNPTSIEVKSVDFDKL
jgi:S-adenosylmethionine/arginine decarboxylase-like enzyme